MMVLLITFIFYIDSVFGMDSFSDKPESSNEEKSIDLTGYIKQELNLNNLNFNVKIETYDQNILAIKLNETEENAGIRYPIKRKHKEEKLCKYCKRENINGNLVKSQLDSNVLNPLCHHCEWKNKKFKPINEQKKGRKHVHRHILTCEFCQKDDTKFITGKFSGKSLCTACYNYEFRHGLLKLRNKDKNNEIHKDHILVCEFCQKESKYYITGKSSGKSLCRACYGYESRYGYLIPVEKRKSRQKRNLSSHDEEKEVYVRILYVCEFCQKGSTSYVTSEFGGKLLCKTCYGYESRHGQLVPRDEKNFTMIHKDQILACECCQKKNIRYVTGKVTGKSLCLVCYGYESRHGHLVPRDERKKKQPQYRKDSSNILIDGKIY